VAEFVAEGWIWKQTPDGFSDAAYEGRPFEITETVEDGTLLDLGDRTLEVLLTPGHAPDSLCLVDRQNRLLFTGDTYYPAPLYAHLEGSDFNQYRQTAQRLAGLTNAVDFVLPSHNQPLIQGGVLTEMAQAFEAVASGELDYTTTDGNREYRFEGFTILTPADLESQLAQ
jgi:glyoxylase-like metal-dependent hydrolase (beta-lactamase superfamily II)